MSKIEMPSVDEQKRNEAARAETDGEAERRVKEGGEMSAKLSRLEKIRQDHVGQYGTEPAKSFDYDAGRIAYLREQLKSMPKDSMSALEGAARREDEVKTYSREEAIRTRAQFDADATQEASGRTKEALRTSPFGRLKRMIGLEKAPDFTLSRDDVLREKALVEDKNRRNTKAFYENN